MTKEEILAKSRNEKKDEGTEYIASRGRALGRRGDEPDVHRAVSFQLGKRPGQLSVAGGVLGVSEL